MKKGLYLNYLFQEVSPQALTTSNFYSIYYFYHSSEFSFATFYCTVIWITSSSPEILSYTFE